jgi:hypothetical protein
VTLHKQAVRFIDAATGIANVEHPTNDILCCLAAEGSEGVFGYVASVAAGAKAFCHVFAAKVPGLTKPATDALNRAAELATNGTFRRASSSDTNPFL